MTTAAIYARKSTEQNGVADESRSVARQIENARAYAEGKGWSVDEAHIYVDDGVSGAEFDERRPGLLRMLATADVKRPPFGVLVMSEESRLGREQIATANALRTLIKRGIRVFYYLTGQERTLNSPTDKLLMSVSAFADEVEREKARQRTRDAMERLAKQGHVTGGACFGYDNVPVFTPEGRRSHVERRINEQEAVAIRRVFELCAQGFGLRGMAHRMNEEGTLAPRPQQGRPAGWAPSSLRSVLYRRLYVGEIEWARTAKRNSWGEVRPTKTPDAVVRVRRPDLQIVPDELWQAAHARIEDSRRYYLRAKGGKLDGNPGKGTESSYLLVGMASCGVCGATLTVTSRKSGAGRGFRYRCSANHRKGAAVCGNTRDIPMAILDQAVLAAVQEQVLAPAVIEAIVARVVAESQKPSSTAERDRLAAMLAEIEQELERLTRAVAAGAETPSILTAIKEREGKRAALAARLATLSAIRDVSTLDLAAVRKAAQEHVAEWAGLMERHTPQARQILRKLLHGRVIVQPTPERADWYAEITATATIGKLLAGSVELPHVLASPTGFALQWHHDETAMSLRVASPPGPDLPWHRRLLAFYKAA